MRVPDLDRFPLPGSWYIGLVVTRVIAKSSSASSRTPVAETDRIRWVLVVCRHGLGLLDDGREDGCMDDGCGDDGWTEAG